MNHDHLRHELNRRANSISLDADWAQRELLPAVGAGISARRALSPASRVPAFVGLAAAAVAGIAVVAVLVVASPRLGLGPSGSDSTSSIAMSAQEFASRYFTDELDGQTVVVAGRIHPYDGDRFLYGTVCNGMPTSDGEEPVTCVLGRLDRVDRNVGVNGTYVNIAPEIWQSAVAPIAGHLVIRVSDAGFIELLGTLKQSTDDPRSPETATELDISGFTAHDVVLVEGWLVSPEGPGTSIVVSCAVVPPFTPVPGLPNEYCQPSDSIASDRIASGRGNFPDGPHLAVQRSAAETFGITSDEPATYAVAPRLHALCQTSAPCWEWEVIAHVTESAELDQPLPSSPPTPNGPTERPTPQPAETGLECTTMPAPPREPVPPGSVPRVLDETALVESCSSVPATTGHSRGVWITNIIEDETVVVAEWSGTPCDARTAFTFRRVGERYEFSGVRPDEGCDMSLNRHAMRIQLREPVPAALIDASIQPDPDLGPMPTRPPGATPQISGVVECEGPPRGIPAPWSLPSVSDETGLVVRCQAIRQEGSQEEALLVTNPGGDASMLEVTWSGACVDFQFTLRRTPTDAFQLIVFNPTPFNVICDGPLMSSEMRLYLSEPIDRELVSLTMTRAPPATPLPRPSPAMPPPWDEAVECEGSPSGLANGAVRIADHTGLVTICQMPDLIDGDPAWLPDMSGVLTFSWETACASDSHRTLLELWPREPATDELQRAPYVLLANRIEPDQSDGLGCRSAINTRTVQLLTDPPLTQEDVEIIVISEEDTVDVVGADRSMFHLSMSATKPVYSAFEKVDVTAELRYRAGGDVIPVSGMSVEYTVEQLDGSMSVVPGLRPLVCSDQELHAGEPRVFSLTGGFVRSPSGEIDYVNAYSPDPFVLPPGVYRVHVDVRFVIGELCSGESIALQASMMVRVE